MSIRRRLALGAVRYAPGLLSLERLAAAYGTDKVDRFHTHNGLTNAAVYDRYLHDWRKRRFTLLELGVLHGESLRMWDAYFPKATVIGLDIDPGTARDAAEFEVNLGSQADRALLDAILDRHPGLRLVIDDASHVNELTIASFQHLFPRLQPGALYIIEDLAPLSYEGARPEWPGMSLNEGVSLENRREDLDRFLNALIRDCDLGGHPDHAFERTVSFVHVWPSLVVVGRA